MKWIKIAGCLLLLLTACQQGQLKESHHNLQIQNLSTTPLNNGTQSDIKTNLSNRFVDIQNHWAQPSIEIMQKKGIVAGVGNGRFAPNANVTRAQFAAFLLRTLEIKPTLPEKTHFTDVDKDEWYAASVETAYKEGLIGGYPDNIFKPTEKINRLEMALLLVRAIKRFNPTISAPRSELNGFTDTDKIGNWAKDDLAIAIKTGLISGLPGNIFGPNGKATRAQSVVTLYRVLLYQSGGLKKPSGNQELGSIPIDVMLTDWKLDETNGFIYGIANTSSFLYIIKTNPLTVVTKVPLSGKAQDFDYLDQKVYISIPEKNMIDEVDIQKKKVVKSYGIDRADQIAVDEANGSIKIFYTKYSAESSVPLAVYDITNDKGEMISKNLPGSPNNVYNPYTIYSHPTLTVDRENNFLWLGERGSSNSKVYKITTTDYTRGNWEGLFYPKGKIIASGSDVFFGGKRYSSKTYKEVGGYPTDQILFVTEKYVFGPGQIYDRDTYGVVGTYGQGARLAAMDRENNIYIFSASDNSIKKLRLNLQQETTHSSKPTKDRLGLNYEPKAWIVDPELPYIYAILEESNKLLYIRTDTMTVENELAVGLKPSDVKLYKNKLYISHLGTNRLYITDRKFSGKLEQVDLNYPQVDIVAANDKIYYNAFYNYTFQNFESYIVNELIQKAYDLKTKEISGFFPRTHTRYKIWDASQDGKRLFISADKELRVYNATNMELISSGQVGLFSRIFIAENEMFVDNHLFTISPFKYKGTVPSLIGAVTDKHVFAGKKVYNRSDLSPVVDLIHAIDSGKYDAQGQFIIQVGRELIRYSSEEEFIELKQVKEQ